MKKLFLFITLFFCFLFTSFGQHCSYGGNIEDARKLCDFYKPSFSSNTIANDALDKILNVTGMAKRFVLLECSDIDNCYAVSHKGIRYILYDKEFMQRVNSGSMTNLAILCHEIGHHVNGHSLDVVVYATSPDLQPSLAESRQMELEADEFSGFVMCKLGATLEEAQAPLYQIATNEADYYSTHPSLNKRLNAVEKGYNRAKGQGSNNTNYPEYSHNNSNLTADDYFYLAYDDENNWEYQIENYTKCLELDRNYTAAYNNRGLAYYELEKFYDAIDDYNRAIRIDSDYAAAYNNRGLVYAELEKSYSAIDDYTTAIRIDPEYSTAYYNRGISYGEIEDYESAIDDYTTAIEIDPSNSNAYRNRGIERESLGLSYCNDYKSACRLGDDDCCEWYNEQCESNKGNEEGFGMENWLDYSDDNDSDPEGDRVFKKNFMEGCTEGDDPDYDYCECMYYKLKAKYAPFSKNLVAVSEHDWLSRETTRWVEDCLK